MKVSIVVTDQSGNVFEGEAVLSLKAASAAKTKKAISDRPRPAAAVDFSSSLSHFMKTHGKGKSGPKKFALLVAHLAEGQAGTKIVEADRVEGAWNRTKRILGAYNPSYSTRAKDYGWIDAPKHGQYQLGRKWQAVLAN